MLRAAILVLAIATESVANNGNLLTTISVELPAVMNPKVLQFSASQYSPGSEGPSFDFYNPKPADGVYILNPETSDGCYLQIVDMLSNSTTTDEITLSVWGPHYYVTYLPETHLNTRTSAIWLVDQPRLVETIPSAAILEHGMQGTRITEMIYYHADGFARFDFYGFVPEPSLCAMLLPLTLVITCRQRKTS